MVKRIASLIIVIIIFMQITVIAEEIMFLHISEIHQQDTEMKVYFNIFNQGNEPVVKDLNEEDITVLIDGQVFNNGELLMVEDQMLMRCLFLVDISTSMSKEQMSSIREFMELWSVDKGSEDQVGIVTFGDEVYINLNFSADRQEIESAVASIDSKDDTTAFYDGIDKGIHMIQQDNSGFEGRTIMFVFSDAEDVDAGGKTYIEVREQLQAANIPLYGFGTVTNPSSNEQANLDEFAMLARDSGGMYDQESEKNFIDFYQAIELLLDNQYVYQFIQDEPKADYSTHEVTVVVDTPSFNINDKHQYIADSINKIEEENSIAVVDEQITPVVESNEAEDVLSGDDESDVTQVKKLEEKEVSGGEKVAKKPILTKTTLVITSLILAMLVIVSIVIAVVKKSNKGLEVILSYQSHINNKEKKYKVNILRSSITVGRDGNNSITVEDTEMSRTHFRVFFSNGSIYIEDLKSSNGTMLNGTLLKTVTMIHDKDQIKAQP